MVHVPNPYPVLSVATLPHLPYSPGPIFSFFGKTEPGYTFSPSNNRSGHEAAVNEVAKSASLIRHTDTVEGVVLDEIITTSNNPMPR